MTVTDAAGNELTSITLNPRASQTWTADQLGIAEPGSGVVATAEWFDPFDLCVELSTTFTRSSDMTDDESVDFLSDIEAVVVKAGGKTFVEGTDYYYTYESGTLAIHWLEGGTRPAQGSTYTVTVYYDCDPEFYGGPRIAGVEKHTVGTAGARTTSATEAVDGYTAVPQDDVALAGDGGAVLEGQSRWVLPIVQTNNGWNTEIFITNVSGKTNSVSATFYAAGGQGYAGEGEMLLSGKTLAAGETVRIDLLDYGFEEGVVGSLWIDATHAVVAGAFRHKVETGMMLTTNAQPRHDTEGSEVKFGPLVFRDYNGWNTGINIANLSSNDNRVTVTYYNYAGNAVATERVTIPARAMEYVYTPATGNFGIGANQITAVRIEGTQPLVAAIDEVKYLGGQGEGHAMSYPASFAIEGDYVVGPGDEDGRYWYDNLLALPLVQKGNPTTGVGDTSGINLFNPDDDEVDAYIQFVDQSGVPVAPTVGADDSEAPIVLPLSAGAGATVYTLNYSEMPAGFQGAAIVGVVGDGELVGVSNNVNYAVDGDGSAVYNLANTDLYYSYPGE